MVADQLKRRAARAALQTALLGGGALLVLAGIGFLVAALWLYLSLQYGAPFASLIVGTACLGFGLIVIGFAIAKPAPRPATHSDQPPPEPPADASDAPPLVQAFLYGMQAGIKAGKS
ncbi:phage holin family protein [Microbulbifer sp. S227A]|uniref:phage holin family protein n=1 Tax=Microbulbifer sp. S227A TaxID=3415131 RepID=UPI003C7A6F28